MMEIMSKPMVSNQATRFRRNRFVASVSKTNPVSAGKYMTAGSNLKGQKVLQPVISPVLIWCH